MAGDRKFVWLALSLAAGMLVSMFIAVQVSVGRSEKAVRIAIEREKASSETGRKALCLVIQTQVNVYKETPPSTPAGVGAQAAWASLSGAFRCEE